MGLYQQDEKERSRRLLWEYAVERITFSRNETRIIREDYVQSLWEYTCKRLLKYSHVDEIDNTFLESWFGFASSTYKSISAEDIRVAYLCGPEPENDLKILIELGVRIENIWAIEKEQKFYAQALKSVRESYPTLKIFHGSVESLLEINPIPFDIIYLDFTSPLFSRATKPYVTVQTVFERQALSEIGVLITNSSIPDSTSDVVDFLTDYFLFQPFVEGTVLGRMDDKSQPISWFTSGPLMDPMERTQVRTLIEENFEGAYSAFCTQFPILYANLIQPPLRVLGTSTSKRRMFDTSNEGILDVGLEKLSGSQEWLVRFLEGDLEDGMEEGWGFGGDLVLNPTGYPLWHFFRGLKTQQSDLSKNWVNAYEEMVRGVSRLQAIYMGDLLRSVFEGYLPVLSKPLKEALPRINEVLPDRKSRLFCDVPFPSLWVEVALNQLGFPYHPNVDLHKRFAYQAKTRKMFVDVFVFDRCRAFYDWLPMIEFYSQDLKVIERQILARICLDAIGKQIHKVISNLYSATNIICYYEEPWAKPAELCERMILK